VKILIFENHTTKKYCLNPYAPIRPIFGKTVDRIDWDHDSKVAYIENDGRQLVVMQNESFVPAEHPIVWPAEWTKTGNGSMMIHLPFLAYVFDRYAEHEDDSEAGGWKEGNAAESARRDRRRLVPLYEAGIRYETRSETRNACD
jgi:hypothetical protein